MNKREGGTTNIVVLRMLPIDVWLEGPGRMFDPRPLFFNFYMGPNLFHDMWAPRCVVCSTLICGSKFVPFQVDYLCVVL